MLHHLGRPIAELGRDATQVIDQVRRPEAREARERAEPSAHRLIELSPRSTEPKRLGVSRGRRIRDEQVDADGSGHDHDQDPSMVLSSG